MDLNFVDPSEVPVPPEEIQIKRLQADPLADNRRVKVHLELTPFQQRPNLVVAILDDQHNQLAATTIVESVDHILEFTMHLRGKVPAGQYRLRAAAGYQDEAEPVHTAETVFELKG